MKKDIRNEFTAIVRKVIGKPNMEEKELLGMLFIDEGYIDSFQLVEMIAELEEKFGVKFSSAELTSKQFRTFKGVLEIIEGNLGKKKK